MCWQEDYELLLYIQIRDASYTNVDLRKNVVYSVKYTTPTLSNFWVSISSKECEHAPILVMEFLSTNLTSCIEQYGILLKEISYSILYDVALGSFYTSSSTAKFHSSFAEISLPTMSPHPQHDSQDIRSGCGKHPQSDPSTGQQHDTLASIILLLV